MLRSRRSESLTAAVLMAPFVVIYGVLFVYPTIKMVELAFTNAPLIGPGKWVGFDNFWRLYSDRLFSDRCLEHVLFRAPVGDPWNLDRARRRACRKSAEGVAAERRSGGVLPALHPAGVGRLPHLELDVRQGFRRRAICHSPLQRRPAHLGVPHHSALHAGHRHSLRFGGVSASASSFILRACATFRAKSTRPPTSTARPLGAVPTHHLATHLAGDGPCFHNPADPSVQDLRPGLSLRGPRRAVRPDNGDGPVHLQGGLPDEQGRPCLGCIGRPVPPDRRAVGAAISSSCGRGAKDDRDRRRRGAI